jgi:hypothetical protein
LPQCDKTTVICSCGLFKINAIMEIGQRIKSLGIRRINIKEKIKKRIDTIDYDAIVIYGKELEIIQIQIKELENYIIK